MKPLAFLFFLRLASSSASLLPGGSSSILVPPQLTSGCGSLRDPSGRSTRGHDSTPPVRRAQKWHMHGLHANPIHLLGIRGGSFYYSGEDGEYEDNDGYDGDDFGDLDGHVSDYLDPSPLHRNDERDASRLDSAFDILPFVGGMGGNNKHSRKKNEMRTEVF